MPNKVVDVCQCSCEATCGLGARIADGGTCASHEDLASIIVPTYISPPAKQRARCRLMLSHQPRHAEISRGEATRWCIRTE